LKTSRWRRGRLRGLAVTSAAAKALASEGAGLLYKPTGNNVASAVVDIIAYPSGRIIDVLGNGIDSPAPPRRPRGDS
jgi:hypothetical protein